MLKIIKGAAAPLAAPIVRSRKYDFGAMSPGDAIDVENPMGAKQAFYNWRKKTGGKNLRLRYFGVSPDDRGMHRYVLQTVD